MSHDNQGRYKCTPYNVHGTAGASAEMEVLVREPPNFVTKPKPVYQHKIDDDVQMTCEAQGTPNPRITWKRVCIYFMYVGYSVIYNISLGIFYRI